MSPRVAPIKGDSEPFEPPDRINGWSDDEDTSAEPCHAEALGSSATTIGGVDMIDMRPSDVDIKCVTVEHLPFPGLHGVVLRVGSVWWPWVDWVLFSFTMFSCAASCEWAMFLGAVLAFGWLFPALLTLDVRRWRLLVTGKTFALAVLTVGNLAAISLLVGKNATNFQSTVFTYYFFCLSGPTIALVVIMDHDLYGVVLLLPIVLSIIAIVILKFYLTGEFVSSAFQEDVFLVVWERQQSMIMSLLASTTTVFGIGASTVMYARAARRGVPRHVFGGDVLVVHYRRFVTDRLLKTYHKYLIGAVNLGALVFAAIVVLVRSRT